MAYIEHDFPIEELNKIAQKEGNAKAHLPDAQGVSAAAAVGVGGEGGGYVSTNSVIRFS